MSDTIPFVANRFQHNAAYYLQGRPAYAPGLIRRVAAACRLDGRQRLLDLGCGPGPLALAFSTYVASGVALDPEPEMLRIAAAFGLGIAPNIAYRQGSSYDLSPAFGRFDIAVIGRAFHWMDRPDTLARLDSLLEPAGAVVLFGTTTPDDPTLPWMAPYRALLEEYAGEDPARRQHKAQGWRSHDAVLMQSAFSALERITVVEKRRVSLDSLLARPQSMSSLSRARLGARLDTLLDRARALLEPHAQDGWLDERVESGALIARR
jgi:SAM-dependent methyltransferase